MTARATQKGEGVPLILLIEDDANDVFFFRRVLSKLASACEMRVVGSVEEAKRYMTNSAPFDDLVYFRHPDLIVSDFRLPGDTALTFVQWLRTQPDLQNTPVVMLSAAASALDPALFVGLAVHSFLRKTPDIGALGARLEPFLPKTR